MGFPKITLITPTGSRPEAFALCERWIANQVDVDFTKIQWVVVDDCDHIEPTQCNFGQTRIIGPKQWNPEINTQRYNMDLALEHAKGDTIFVIEDDEYYSPKYLSFMLKLLETCWIAGFGNSKYYNVQLKGYRLMDNFRHAPLCNTAIRREALSILRGAVHSGDKFFDIVLWERAMQRELTSCLLSNTSLSIGIKGMPGRAGIGIGHQEVGYKADRNSEILKKWVGEDFKYYEPFLQKGLT